MTMEPTPKQLAEWLAQAMEDRPADELKTRPGFAIGEVARLAYQAGADAELEECCEHTKAWEGERATARLREARRPEPPNLKEQALRDLDGLVEAIRITWGFEPAYPTIIRQALESLPDD